MKFTTLPCSFNVITARDLGNDIVAAADEVEKR